MGFFVSLASNQVESERASQLEEVAWMVNDVSSATCGARWRQACSLYRCRRDVNPSTHPILLLTRRSNNAAHSARKNNVRFLDDPLQLLGGIYKGEDAATLGSLTYRRTSCNTILFLRCATTLTQLLPTCSTKSCLKLLDRQVFKPLKSTFVEPSTG